MRNCLACGAALAGGYVEVNAVGPYCEPCVRMRPPCHVCGAPLGERRWQLSDGRISCAACHATAVYTPQQAREAYGEVVAIAQNVLDLALNVPTGLALVDRTQLEAILRGRREACPGPRERPLGAYVRRGIRRGIYVEAGLPRWLLIEVAAHEYGHAWQGENSPLLRDPLVREGFADWVAYKVLQARGQTRRLARLRSDGDVYGRGLQWALGVEAQAGVAGVAAACRRAP